MKNKYVCPICGSKLVTWEEMQYDKYHSINPNTGNIGKTERKSVSRSLGGSGIRCVNEECSLMYNGMSMTLIYCNAEIEQFKKIEDICEDICEDIFNR